LKWASTISNPVANIGFHPLPNATTTGYNIWCFQLEAGSGDISGPGSFSPKASHYRYQKLKQTLAPPFIRALNTVSPTRWERRFVKPRSPVRLLEPVSVSFENGANRVNIQDGEQAIKRGYAIHPAAIGWLSGRKLQSML